MKSIFRIALFMVMILTWSITPSCTSKIIPDTSYKNVDTNIPTSVQTPDQITGEFIIVIADSMAYDDCKSYIPFEINRDGERLLLEGDGKVHCSFREQMCGDVCVMYNGLYEWDIKVLGILDPATPDFPDGFLHVNFVGPYSYTFWLSNVPPDVYNPTPKEDPFKIEVNDMIPVNINFLNGAKSESQVLTDTAPWAFILHIY